MLGPKPALLGDNSPTDSALPNASPSKQESPEQFQGFLSAVPFFLTRRLGRRRGIPAGSDGLRGSARPALAP